MCSKWTVLITTESAFYTASHIYPHTKILENECAVQCLAQRQFDTEPQLPIEAYP